MSFCFLLCPRNLAGAEQLPWSILKEAAAVPLSGLGVAFFNVRLPPVVTYSEGV